jgi:catechol 2,3-dioxygenase-like lactoylglutathione lyase family enzyme
VDERRAGLRTLGAFFVSKCLRARTGSPTPQSAQNIDASRVGPMGATVEPPHPARANMPPRIEAVDHVHVFVADRAAAEAWYQRVLGFHRTPALEFWAPGGGPLTIQNSEGTVHLALFERPREKCRATVAFRVGAQEFVSWRQHLKGVLGKEPAAVDHDVSWSLYFCDEDGNPFEITSYDHGEIKKRLSDATR